MNEQLLKDGQVLLKIIKITESELAKLRVYQEKFEPEDRRDNRYDDGVYNLFVGEHSDANCTHSSSLSRYMGNKELLDVIVL
jgi:hypothetical protein